MWRDQPMITSTALLTICAYHGKMSNMCQIKCAGMYWHTILVPHFTACTDTFAFVFCKVFSHVVIIQGQACQNACQGRGCRPSWQSLHREGHSFMKYIYWPLNSLTNALIIVVMRKSWKIYRACACAYQSTSTNTRSKHEGSTISELCGPNFLFDNGKHQCLWKESLVSLNNFTYTLVRQATL